MGIKLGIPSSVCLSSSPNLNLVKRFSVKMNNNFDKNLPKNIKKNFIVIGFQSIK